MHGDQRRQRQREQRLAEARDELSGRWEDGVVSRELAVQFVVSTFLTVLTWLLTGKPKLGPSEADAMFRRLVIAGVGTSLRAKLRSA
jgi:hypothetical protein